MNVTDDNVTPRKITHKGNKSEHFSPEEKKKGS